MENSEKNMKISAPWVTFAHQVETFFDGDPDILVDYDDLEKKLTLRVSGTDKADALTELLPAEKNFGGVTLKIVVVPANEKKTPWMLIENALRGNVNYSRTITVPIDGSSAFTYACFKKVVAQYWNDNLGDPNGLVSCLYQDLAREIFNEKNGVFFCTDSEDDSMFE